ncbi:MAG: hypothetical protein J5830_04085, partial [Clostridia bacterium]|nr:hypothetical protein [Clostridia bacterium]
MRKVLLLWAALLLGAGLSAMELTGDTVVVRDGLTLDSENKAAELLAETLGKVLSQEIRVVDRGEYAGQ